jgi:preprotein translocase subunit SecG
MQIFLTILHLMLCFGLFLIILLQPGKEGASVLGGGGGNQMYGPRGQGNLLSRGTTLIAAMFMVTSIALAWYSSDRTSSGSDIGSELERLQQEQTQTVTPPPAAPAPVAPPPVVPAPTDAAVEPPAPGPAEGAPADNGPPAGAPAAAPAAAPVGEVVE